MNGVKKMSVAALLLNVYGYGASQVSLTKQPVYASGLVCKYPNGSKKMVLFDPLYMHGALAALGKSRKDVSCVFGFDGHERMHYLTDKKRGALVATEENAIDHAFHPLHPGLWYDHNNAARLKHTADVVFSAQELLDRTSLLAKILNRETQLPSPVQAIIHGYAQERFIKGLFIKMVSPRHARSFSDKISRKIVSGARITDVDIHNKKDMDNVVRTIFLVPSKPAALLGSEVTQSDLFTIADAFKQTCVVPVPPLLKQPSSSNKSRNDYLKRLLGFKFLQKLQ